MDLNTVKTEIEEWAFRYKNMAANTTLPMTFSSTHMHTNHTTLTPTMELMINGGHGTRRISQKICAMK